MFFKIRPKQLNSRPKAQIHPQTEPQFLFGIDIWRDIDSTLNSSTARSVEMRLSRVLPLLSWAAASGSALVRGRLCNLSDHDLVTSHCLGQGLRTPCRGRADSGDHIDPHVSNPTFLSIVRIFLFSRSESAVFNVKTASVVGPAKNAPKTLVFGGHSAGTFQQFSLLG